MLTAISDGMVALLKEFYGRGPTRTKSYYADDLVVCVLRGGFSRVEQTLLEGGRGAAVIQQRMEFQEVMRSRFEEVIERATGRRVIGFMSGNQQHPDMMCEVFILAPHRSRRRGRDTGVAEGLAGQLKPRPVSNHIRPDDALSCPAEGITAVGPQGAGIRT